MSLPTHEERDTQERYKRDAARAFIVQDEMLRRLYEQTGEHCELDNLLGELIYARDEYLGKLNKAHDSVAEVFIACDRLINVAATTSSKYLDYRWMHTPKLTNLLVTSLIDPCLRKVEGESEPHFCPDWFTSYWRLPWGALVPSLLSFVFFAASSALIAVLFWLRFPWLAWPGIALLAWHYALRFLIIYLTVQTKKRQAALAKALRSEVISELYDAPTVARRLRQLEQRGVYVHSLTYRLLRLRRAGVEGGMKLDGPEAS